MAKSPPLIFRDQYPVKAYGMTVLQVERVANRLAAERKTEFYHSVWLGPSGITLTIDAPHGPRFLKALEDACKAEKK